jgi:hypothetical protein
MGSVNDETRPALTRFDFTSGLQRGSHLLLYPRSLVHRSEGHLETMHLAHINAVRVAFERHPRQIGWGAALVVLALVVLAIAGPMGSTAHSAAQEMMTSGQGVGRALYTLFRVIEMIAALLPAAALIGTLGGAALLVLGWRGSTTLTLMLSGGERAFSARGRDTLLLDFAELLSQRVLSQAR